MYIINRFVVHCRRNVTDALLNLTARIDVGGKCATSSQYPSCKGVCANEARPTPGIIRVITFYRIGDCRSSTGIESTTYDLNIVDLYRDYFCSSEILVYRIPGNSHD